MPLLGLTNTVFDDFRAALNSSASEQVNRHIKQVAFQSKFYTMDTFFMMNKACLAWWNFTKVLALLRDIRAM